MSKLTVESKTVYELFNSKNADFLIPDYQRPYAWDETECETLWNDLFNFTFPENSYDNFNNKEYFLGPIVMFINDNKKMEIIDGQQRLTTLMLLLRAFYESFGKGEDKNTSATKRLIATCIWQTDEFNEPTNKLKIDSEVATDDDRAEFLEILQNGDVDDSMKSRYADNYRFFKEKISTFKDDFSYYFTYFPIRILHNCILLPIEAESQDTALTIFNTLNDRGLPLSDSDIFKSQLYKYYSQHNKEKYFIEEWKKLEEENNKDYDCDMDDLFTKYMYYKRAQKGIKTSTTESLRDFYENFHIDEKNKDKKYEILQNDYVLEELKLLSNFWQSVKILDADKFDNNILTDLTILKYAPNGMWEYFISVYYLQNRKKFNNDFNNNYFLQFLDKTIAFIWGYSIDSPTVNALRTPIYNEMVKIINDKDIDFNNFKFDKTILMQKLDSCKFSNRSPMTRSMLMLWTFKNKDNKQELISSDIKLDIEHIVSRNRQENDEILLNEDNLECLGNKSLLEKRINIRASDYRFCDKKKFYIGYKKGNKYIDGTKINELLEIAKLDDFTEEDIEKRDLLIKKWFISYLKENCLIK